MSEYGQLYNRLHAINEEKSQKARELQMLSELNPSTSAFVPAACAAWSSVVHAATAAAAAAAASTTLATATDATTSGNNAN